MIREVTVLPLISAALRLSPSITEKVSRIANRPRIHELKEMEISFILSRFPYCRAVTPWAPPPSWRQGASWAPRVRQGAPTEERPYKRSTVSCPGLAEGCAVFQASWASPTELPDSTRMVHLRCWPQR